jgi:acyl carrier protein
MSHNNGVSERLRGFILKKFPLARKRGLKDDEPLLETGIVDSLGVLDLVGFIEQEFSISVSDEELTPENFQTIGGLTDFVRKKSRPGAGLER